MSNTTSGNEFASKGLRLFLSEDYKGAEQKYQQAAELEPDNETYREMVELSHRNVVAGAELVIPPVTFFKKEELLSEPKPGPLPNHVHIPEPRGPWRSFLIAAGTGLGVISTAITNVLTASVGKLFGYKDRVWTDWYRRPESVGMLTLAYMRDQLFANNLKNTYPPGKLIGFQQPGLQPPPGVEQFRTADGSWNNLDNPKEGAAGTRFPRFVELSAGVPETGEELMTPNPREVSRSLLARGEKMLEVPFLNMFAAAWIQFMNDDWINHGEHLKRESERFVIPFAEDDPARVKFGQDCLKVGKTQPDPTYGEAKEDVPVTFINECTAWWDGSQLYGSDIATQRSLRTMSGGKMELRANGTLPRDERGIERAGMTRNWWVGLSMLHSLFLQEHNAICDMLAKNHPDWSDDVLFNVARLINAAVMAKIHTVEWTPAILPNPGLTMGLNANWYGILTYVFKPDKQRKTLSEIKIRNPELGGVVGNPINKHNCPYSLAEEFVEVYRLHSLLPETLQVRSPNSDGTVEIPFVETRQIGAAKIVEERPMADLLFSFGKQQPGQLVLNNYPHFLRELSIPGNPVYDMAAVDILRARERGVPRYNAFRRLLALGPISKFEDLFPAPQTPPTEADQANARQLAELKRLYNDDVEKLDLLVGTLSEGIRPTGFGFGETMFQIFILAASRRLQADRFYTDCYDEAHYTNEGLDWIDQANLKTVLLRHYPELGKTGLGNITNAFEPWDDEKLLDLARHPLRQWDSDLKSDPALGNLYR